MSRRRVYSDGTLAVMDRYFQAMEACKRQKLIKSVSDYCTEYGIAKPHYYTQRKDLNRGFFEVGWMLPLVEKCHVSAYWLMTGKGQMFG